MNQEQQFWQRFIELAKSSFKASIFDFYVADAKLLGIHQQVATIFLNRPFKKISGKKFRRTDGCSQF